MNLKKEIDQRFLNSETNSHFENCLVCHKNVLESEEDYFIEKIIRNVAELNLQEALFEYAICIKCAENMRKQLSTHSLEQMEIYFKEKARLNERRSFDPFSNETTNNCLFLGKEIKDCKEYSLHAHCRGAEMIISVFPYAVCDDAMDEMSERLSKETLGELDNFKRTYFNGPPEFADLISPKRLLPI